MKIQLRPVELSNLIYSACSCKLSNLDLIYLQVLGDWIGHFPLHKNFRPVKQVNCVPLDSESARGVRCSCLDVKEQGNSWGFSVRRIIIQST